MLPTEGVNFLTSSVSESPSLVLAPSTVWRQKDYIYYNVLIYVFEYNLYVDFSKI